MLCSFHSICVCVGRGFVLVSACTCSLHLSTFMFSQFVLWHFFRGDLIISHYGFEYFKWFSSLCLLPSGCGLKIAKFQDRLCLFKSPFPKLDKHKNNFISITYSTSVLRSSFGDFHQDNVTALKCLLSWWVNINYWFSVLLFLARDIISISSSIVLSLGEKQIRCNVSKAKPTAVKQEQRFLIVTVSTAPCYSSEFLFND